MRNFTRKFLLLFFLPLLSLIAKGQPVANFTANFITGCDPLVVQFTSTSTGTNASTTYSWNLGNGVTSVLQNPSTTYSGAGTYTVTLTVSNGTASNTKTITNYITVKASPTVSFTVNNTSGCPGSTIQFTNTSVLGSTGAGSYVWNFGDGTSDFTQNPSHTFSTPGNYNIALQVTNSAGCSKTVVDSNYIHIYAPPVADFTSNNQSFCHAPATVTFTVSTTGSGPFTYAWNYGDNTTGTGNNPTHTYTNTGNYTVRLITTDSHGCKDTISKTNYIQITNITPAFTGPTSACIGDSVLFLNTTLPSPTGAMWYFGDGGTSNGIDGKHAYTTAGTYTVKLVTQSGTCSDSITHQITIRPSPVANFTFSPQIPCPAPSTVNFTNTSTGANSYTWRFGDNGTSTLTSPSHNYTNNYQYDVTLVATSSFGCKDSVTKQLLLPDLYVNIYSSKTSGCIPLSIDFSAFPRTHTVPPLYNTDAAYPTGISTYSWDFGDGTATSTAATPTHVFTDSGAYWIKLTITTANGCTTTDSVQVLAGPRPHANFTVTPTTTCMRDAVHFTNTSTNATNYIWQFGDGGASSDINPIYQFTLPGLWSVMLIASNNGCNDTLFVPQMITVLAPKSRPEVITIACDSPTKVTFADASIGDSTWLWMFGDGTTSTVKNPVHYYPGLGFYSVKLATYNSTTGCRDTASIPLNLIAINPNFVSTDTAICKNDTGFFSANNYTGLSHLQWTVNGTTFLDTTPNFKYKFTDTGIYTIVFAGKDANACVHTVTKTSYMHVSKPYVNFVGTPLLGCTPLLVNFTDSTKNIAGAFSANLQWFFGDNTNTTSTTNTANHTYTTAGAFDLKLIVTDNVGCKDSFTRPAYVEARHPHANFTASKTGPCIGETITFSNTSQSPVSMQYNWNFGDNTTDNVASPTHAYTQTGSYTVRLIVTDASGCKDTMTKTAYISVTKPDAAFTMSDSVAICPPLLVQFTNASTGAISYNWDFGNGGVSIVTNPTNPYNSAGQYTIRMIAMDGQGCTDTAYNHVKVLGYAGALTYTPLAGCSPLTVSFTSNITNVPSLIWDFSDGVTQNATGATTTHTYTAIGAYVPKLIISDGAGCLTSSLGLDTIKVDGVYPDFTYVAPACLNTPVQIQDNSTSPFSAMSSWSWYFDNGIIAGGQQTTHVYTSTGSFPVKLIATNSRGCRDSIVKNITVLPLPVISAGLDTVICKGDAATLQPGGGTAYTWVTSPTLSCTNCTNPQATPTVPTDYVVIGTGTNGCKNTDTVRVSLKTKTVSDAGQGGEICVGEKFQLEAHGAQSYQWSPAASLDNSQSKTPLAAPTANTTYMLIASEGSCIPDTNYVTVVVHPKPTVQASGDQKIIAGSYALLNATGTGVQTFVWYPAENLSCDTCASTKASPKQTTVYTVEAISQYGCIDSDKVTVQILCDQSQVYIPNSFTPNGDGHNDYFYPRGQGLEKINTLRVYNRWGEVVYEKTNFSLNDKSMGWDGTYKGAALHADVFVYTIEGVCDNGEPINWKGDVTLIR